SVSVTIALVLATGMRMIFGELVAKNMAIAEPLRTAELVVGFQRLLTKVFGLPIRMINGNANAVMRALDVDPEERLGYAGSHVARAHDAMVPRGRMYSLEIGDSVAELLELARVTGHSRFPVLDDEN